MYGRTFPLVAITHHAQLGRCCVVWLQPHVERFIPVQATNLAFDPNAISPSPLSLAAVEHLLRVFQDIQHAHQGVSRDASPYCSNGPPLTSGDRIAPHQLWSHLSVGQQQHVRQVLIRVAQQLMVHRPNPPRTEEATHDPRSQSEPSQNHPATS